MELKDKVVIITGASSGIGRGIAIELNHAGMKLVLTGRREDRLEGLKKELNNTVICAGDICDPNMPDRLIQIALDTFGRCDVVINNAGIMHAGRIEDIDIDAINRMIEVNVAAVTRLSYTALRHFKKNNSGHLINISSILGTKVRETAGAYAGTKYAVEALTEALRIEVAKTGVKVSVIEPGLVKTELQDHFALHPAKLMNITVPLEPKDIARAARFILEQPDHVTVPILMMLPSQHAI